GAFACLSKDDQRNMQLFQNTQDCILNEIGHCTGLAGAEKLREVEDWLANTTETFMRPYIDSLNQRCNGGSVTDAGWNAFFGELDSGELDRRLIGGLEFALKNLWNETFEGGLLSRVGYDEDDFLLLKSHRVAHAMAQ